MIMGEKWLYEDRTFHYIVVLPIGIFQGWGRGGREQGMRGRGKTHSLTVAAYIDKFVSFNIHCRFSACSRVFRSNEVSCS